VSASTEDQAAAAPERVSALRERWCRREYQNSRLGILSCIFVNVENSLLPSHMRLSAREIVDSCELASKKLQSTTRLVTWLRYNEAQPGFRISHVDERLWKIILARWVPKISLFRNRNQTEDCWAIVALGNSLNTSGHKENRMKWVKLANLTLKRLVSVPHLLPFMLNPYLPRFVSHNDARLRWRPVPHHWSAA